MPASFQEWTSQCRQSTEKEQDEAWRQSLSSASPHSWGSAASMCRTRPAQPRTWARHDGQELQSYHRVGPGVTSCFHNVQFLLDQRWAWVCVHSPSSRHCLSPSATLVLNEYVLCTYHIPGPLLDSGYVAVNKTSDPHGAYCLISKADTGQVIKNINLTQCLVPWDPEMGGFGLNMFKEIVDVRYKGKIGLN